MCTVSVIRVDGTATTAGRLRAVVNRDELRGRAAGLRPRIVVADGVRAIMPIDPASGGTWLAVNEAGLVFAVLNDYSSPAAGAHSRGLIIPAIVSASSIADVKRRLRAGDWRTHRPWRLYVFATTAWLEATADRATESALPACVARSSSSLNEAIVVPRRLSLFAAMVPVADSDRQDAFHRHRWDDAPEASVWMSRREAATVSRAIVEVSPDRIRMSYESLVGSSDPIVSCEMAPVASLA